jgi:hypothetical protein
MCGCIVDLSPLCTTALAAAEEHQPPAGVTISYQHLYIPSLVVRGLLLLLVELSYCLLTR